MNKFKGITVLHLEKSDYAGEALNPSAEQETITADIVIEGDKVVKNRVYGMGLPRKTETLKTFKGLSLDSSDALKNIAFIIETGHLMTSCSDKECEEIGDVIIDFARQYAVAAYTYAQEKRK
ncbi:TPA: hypothetical protein I8Y21_003853 [Klebsiella oxytoca]|uniref:Uncharacterized protein n=1 Tax=Klebsiella oxytoca TaxID=571 RepID=A0AAN5REW2_KLEOX|nr:hypothetical protein [Klebsiella oxytoca]